MPGVRARSQPPPSCSTRPSRATPTARCTHAQGRWIKGTRWSLLKAPAKQKPQQLELLAEVQQANKALYRAFLLKEELRLLYRLERPSLAPAHLDAWLAWASRSKLEPFVRLARTIRLHRHGILAAIRLGLTNGRLEGLNSRIRLISHRSFGFRSPAALIALIYLCCTASRSSYHDDSFTPKRTEAPIMGRLLASAGAQA